RVRKRARCSCSAASKSNSPSLTCARSGGGLESAIHRSPRGKAHALLVVPMRPARDAGHCSMNLSPDEWVAVRLTLTVAARAVGFGLPLAVLTAWVLTRYRFPGRPLLNALVHLPLVLPPVVTGWLLLILFGIRGPVGSLLFGWFGIRLVFTTAGASLACAVMTFPVMVRSVRLALDAVDPGLEQAARTLGAGRLDRLLTVTLPLASPGILVGAIVGYATCLGEFGAVITFAANIPGQTQTLPLAIYAALQVPGGEARAAELSLVSLTLALIGLLLSEWLGRRLNAALGR